MIPAVDFDSNLHSSLDELSEETWDKLEEEPNPEIVTETLSFEDLVLTFLLELRELKKASDVSCEFVARSISSLLEATNVEQKIEEDRLLKEFNAKSSQEIGEHLQEKLSSFVSLQKAFEKFFNQKTLNSFVAKQPSFATTSEIKLNTEELSRDHVSILRSTEVLLSKEDVQKFVLSSDETENEVLICESKDGLIYENNTLWTSSNQTIQPMLYCDEFVCANPLGNKVKKCKISEKKTYVVFN